MPAQALASVLHSSVRLCHGKRPTVSSCLGDLLPEEAFGVGIRGLEGLQRGRCQSRQAFHLTLTSPGAIDDPWSEAISSWPSPRQSQRTSRQLNAQLTDLTERTSLSSEARVSCRASVSQYTGDAVKLATPSRRAFVRSSLIGFPAIVPARVQSQNAPSNQLSIAFIGTGNNGTNWLKPFLQDQRVRVRAVCDVNREGGGYWSGSVRGREPARRLVNEHYGDNSCAALDDFRDVVAREDIDSIYIGTPDHWHALIAIAAARAGKHIYGQKPLSLTVREGRAMADAVKTAGIVWQTGSQQRSDSNFLKVCELVRNNRLGRIHTVRVGLPRGRPDMARPRT